MSFGAPASGAPEPGGGATAEPEGGASAEPDPGGLAELDAEADALDEEAGGGASVAGAWWVARFCRPIMTPHPTRRSDSRVRMIFLRTVSPHHCPLGPPGAPPPIFFLSG
mgnify:CR=1 FL=1